jgi:hypothetical protein
LQKLEIEIALPTGQPPAPVYHLSARRPNLSRTVLGLLDNGKVGSDVLLSRIGALFRTDFGLASIVQVRKPSPALPVPDAVLKQLMTCNAVICGVGD